VRQEGAPLADGAAFYAGQIAGQDSAIETALRQLASCLPVRDKIVA
jgi:hypothetical protein